MQAIQQTSTHSKASAISMATEVHQVLEEQGSRRATTVGACYRCGISGHISAECRFKDAKCHGCGKTGHIRKVCRSMKEICPGYASSPGAGRVKRVSAESEAEEPEEYTMFSCSASRGKVKPLEVSLKVHGQTLAMERHRCITLNCVRSYVSTPLATGTAERIPRQPPNIHRGAAEGAG